MKTQLTTLIGQYIQLEPIALHHADGLRRAANFENIWAYMPHQAHERFFAAWFDDCLAQHVTGKKLTYVIRQLTDQTIVGSRSYYDIDLQSKRLEIGYGWLTPTVWGTQLNHESLLLLFQQAFEQWHFNRIQIGCDPRNMRSYNTLKKLGAKAEGILRQHMIHHHGEITDTALFSILAHEWPAVKTTFIQRLYQK